MCRGRASDITPAARFVHCGPEAATSHSAAWHSPTSAEPSATRGDWTRISSPSITAHSVRLRTVFWPSKTSGATEWKSNRRGSWPPCCRTRYERPRRGSAAFLGARGEDIAFVSNATTGCNAVLRSLSLRPGDEVLVLDHGYGAVRNTVRFVTERAGARMTEATIPFPDVTADGIVGAVSAALGPADAPRGHRPHHLGQRSCHADRSHHRRVP